MRVLVCGSRKWYQRAIIRRRLEQLPEKTIIIHGAARGADTMAGEIARKLGFGVRQYSALWSDHGRAAGPMRNQVMLEEGKPDLVLAFHAYKTGDKGTRDMVKKARDANVAVEEHYANGTSTRQMTLFDVASVKGGKACPRS